MLIAIDKRGSINLPAAIRKELGLETGSYLELEILEGGAISLHPVTVHRTLRINEEGIRKLREARNSGKGSMPEWLNEEIKNARSDTDNEVS